jgi:Fe-S cluster biogenesis protein NfuA
MDVETVQASVLEAGRMLRADGADLILVEADPATSRIRLRLEVNGARCEECILPPGPLRDVISAAIARDLHEEFELVLEDPRVP